MSKVELISLTPNAEKTMAYIARVSNPKNQKNLEVIDPSTEKSCAVISLGDKDDIHEAVMAAKKAFTSWGLHQKRKDLNT